MLQPIYFDQLSSKKVDICFYNSLKQHLRNCKCTIGFYAVRILLVGWVLITHLLQKQIDDLNAYRMVTSLFSILITFNILALAFQNWKYKNFLTNNKLIQSIAENLQHSRNFDENNLEQMESYEVLSPLNLKVSKHYYQFENNILSTDIDQEYKKRAQRQCCNLIIQSIFFNQWMKFWTQLFNIASFAIFIYTIVLFSQGNAFQSNESIFMICYLLTEVCSRLFLYLMLFIVAISPLCCFAFCIYYCFCKKQIKVQLPASQQATIEMVKQCEGSCPICFQDIKLKDNVIVLKCSPKHIYHDLCIKGWTKIRKDTCPVCRALI